MFKDNTVFVVGAGASKEFGLPVGLELSNEIKQRSNFRFDLDKIKQGDRALYDTLLRRFNRNGEYINSRLSALRRIHDGIYLASSIDNYIDIHSEDLEVAEMGKVQIANAISIAERSSSLFVDPQSGERDLSLPKQNGTWIDDFARILFEKIKRSEIEQIGKNVAIICFNYDRCIEQYLIEAIRQTFANVSYDEAHSIVSKMQIIHPYGTLGELPSSSHRNDSTKVSFGLDIKHGLDPWTAIEGLKTYTEQVNDPELLSRIRSTIENAAQLVFLGFAFHPQNMDLLTLEKSKSPPSIFTTGKGIHQQETVEITNRILRLFAGKKYVEATERKKVQIEIGASCSELFSFHWRNLSQA